MIVAHAGNRAEPPHAHNESSVQLRPYQHEALNAVEGARRAGRQRLLVALPTGTGKTVIFAELIRRYGGRAVVVVHRDELVQQTVAKVRAACPDASIGVVKAGRNEVDADVIVASV